MLAIRLTRVGRKAHAVYRIAVQEAQLHPSSGRVVAYVGTYDPHTKQYNLDKEKIEQYLSHGAQPTPRVISLLKKAEIALPAWVKEPKFDKQKPIKNPEKLRKNRPAEEVATEAPAEAADETAADTSAKDTEAPAESEATSEEKPAKTEASEAEKSTDAE